jgi:phenylpropionate dioxygenase-like ring-hydroxylating dioxygenase large terminal subunit
VKGYPVQEAHGFIFIWNGDFQEEYPPLPWLENIDDSFPYATFSEIWNVHYTRAIENQLDVVHLPFVHFNTIGKGNKVVVDGPVVLLLDEQMKVWSKNHVEDGTLPKTAEEMDYFKIPYHLEFRFPNIWQNYILEAMRIMVAFVPVDDDHTKLYLRYYQKFVRIPLLKNLVCAIGNKFNKKVLHQDKRVVETQIPKKTWLKMGENLISGDSPIILFRKHRQEILDQQEN